MYHVRAQGVDERVLNVHYYYYYYIIIINAVQNIVETAVEQTEVTCSVILNQ